MWFSSPFSTASSGYLIELWPIRIIIKCIWPSSCYDFVQVIVELQDEIFHHSKREVLVFQNDEYDVVPSSNIRVRKTKGLYLTPPDTEPPAIEHTFCSELYTMLSEEAPPAWRFTYKFYVWNMMYCLALRSRGWFSMDSRIWLELCLKFEVTFFM